MPAVGIFQSGHQLGGARLTQTRWLGLFKTVRRDAINTATIVAAVQIEELFDVVGERPGVLDDFAIHVNDVECAIRRVGKLHRTKPGIAGSGKFDFFLVGRPLRLQTHAIRNQDFAMDEVPAGISDKCVVEELSRIRVAAVNRRARGAGEVTRSAPAAFNWSADQPRHAPLGADNAPGFFRTDAVHLGGRAVHRDARDRRGHGIAGVSRRVTIIIHVEANVVAIVAGETASIIIKAQAMLSPAGFRGHRHRARLNHEIPAVQVERFGLGMPERFAHAPVAAGRAVDAVVQAPDEGVQHPLHIDTFDTLRETGKDHFANVRLAVAVGILQVKDVRRRADEDAAIVAENRGGPGQVVRKNGAFVEDTISIGVLQQPDAAQMRNFLAALRVINHLHHEHPASFVERESHGTDHVRFASRDLDMEPILALEGLGRVLGLNSRETRQVVRGYRRLGRRTPDYQKDGCEQEGGPTKKMSHIGRSECPPLATPDSSFFGRLGWWRTSIPPPSERLWHWTAGFPARSEIRRWQRLGVGKYTARIWTLLRARKPAFRWQRPAPGGCRSLPELTVSVD